ncbi:MAG: copper chaperone PCu(A)C [Cohaesibacter sp.]|jgi:copper(I)-binding protein|nr:copper chaperone PCu(A)C [Cohaesibacter sp.]
MKKILTAALLSAVLATPALAADVKLGDLTISGAFARATAGKAKAGGSFMTIKNAGAADRLVSASSDVAARTELHTHIMDGDVMRMREVKDGIPVPEKGEVALKPGGYHVMLMKLKQPLKQGETFPIELTFEKAGKVTVDIKIGKVGAMKPMKGMKMDGDMKKDGMKKAN